MRILFVILMSVLMFSACESNVDTDKVALIEQLLESKNYESAQDECDDITAEAELKDIPVKDLCRLSLIYAKLSEKSNEDENMAMATKCFHQATEISADTVVEFFAKLPVEDAQYGELLKMLSSAIDAPRDISDRDYEDCVEEEHGHEHDDK